MKVPFKFSSVVIACLVLAGITSAAKAATPPKVVFIGDYITYLWASGFAANPNWINKGVTGVAIFGDGGSDAALARFQSDVVSLHPAIVHIMVGTVDAQFDHDVNYTSAAQDFEANLDAMVKQAEAANIKVILGTTLSLGAGLGVDPFPQLNSIIESYGAAHNIPVVNYGDAMCGCIGVVPDSTIGYDLATGNALLEQSTYPYPNNYGLVPSTVGYALMTELAEEAISTISLSLKSGWLQDVEQANGRVDGGPNFNVNTVSGAAVVQFTPHGVYSDGSQHLLLNSNFTGSSGTWTSTNPLVMYVSQKGLAWALSSGTATIRYVSPSGVKFSSWVMTVQ